MDRVIQMTTPQSLTLSLMKTLPWTVSSDTLTEAAELAVN